MTGVLDVWTLSGTSLELECRRLLQNSSPHVMVVMGPSDAGKTTIWRRALLHRGTPSPRVHVLDAEENDVFAPDIPGDSAGVVVIDHLDRSPASSTVRAGHEVLIRWIPALLIAGNRVLLVLNTQWIRRYREMYGTSALVTLRHANPHHSIECFQTRPYTPEDLLSLPDAALLPAEMFDDENLRLPGLVSLALEIARETESYPMERDAAIGLALTQALRWINNPPRDDDRLVREALWLHFGARELEGARPSAPLAEIYRALGGTYSTAMVREQCRGILEASGQGFRLKSASLRTAAGAWFLKHVINSDLVPACSLPISSKVVDATVQLLAENAEDGLSATNSKLDAFRGQQLDLRKQLLVCAIATVVVRLAGEQQVDLSGLNLCTGDHQSAEPVPDAVRTLVRERLVRHLSEHHSGLVCLLRDLPAGSTSAYDGDPTLWRAVRTWAAGLFAHYLLDAELIANVPSFNRLWRYEDILDDAVTGATTQFMEQHESAILHQILGAAEKPQAWLADIWDGVNDGVWDRISRMREERVDAFVVRDEVEGTVLDLGGSRLQRGRLGTADVSDWRFRGADLLLCDMRSCRGLERSDLRGSNWWDAMLPPHIRYRLSQNERAPEFRVWCAAPPWSNPYYTGAWPAPLTTGGRLE